MKKKRMTLLMLCLTMLLPLSVGGQRSACAAEAAAEEKSSDLSEEEAWKQEPAYGQKLYYSNEQGSVCALDLQSGRSEVIGLNTIPTDEINGRLLIYADDSYELWDDE